MESIVSDTEDGFSLLTIQEKNKVVLSLSQSILVRV